MASSMPSRVDSLFLTRGTERCNARALNQCACQSFSSSTSSKSIPIRLNQRDVREAREIQEDEWIAEERDYFMYQRIVQGMINRSSAAGSSSSNAAYQRETDKAIANIMRTHYKKMDSKSTKDSLAYDDDEPELTDMYNESRRVQCSSCAQLNDSDRPPDTIFIMEL